MSVYVHPSAVVDDGAQLGEGTKVWHFSHVSARSVIGANVSLGQNVFVAPGVKVGDGCKIQNNVSLYEGVELGDYVFCGPSCVFTNVMNPRCEIPRKSEYRPTLVGRGASIGANATIVCGSTIGRYAFIAAGAVVTRGAVPDYALIAGVPGARIGWMSRHGHRLIERDGEGRLVCPESGWRYEEVDGGERVAGHRRPSPSPSRGEGDLTAPSPSPSRGEGDLRSGDSRLRCVDHDEDAVLP